MFYPDKISIAAHHYGDNIITIVYYMRLYILIISANINNEVIFSEILYHEHASLTLLVFMKLIAAFFMSIFGNGFWFCVLCHDSIAPHMNSELSLILPQSTQNSELCLILPQSTQNQISILTCLSYFFFIYFGLWNTAIPQKLVQINIDKSQNFDIVEKW